jgi:serine/threonine protein kinase
LERGATGERTLGAYAVERELGSGGMGTVLLARHKLLERATVLKRLRRELGGGEEWTARFEREARAAASVLHPNVVAVYDAFTWRNELYIAQEFVDGLDLRAALGRAGRLPPRIAGLVALEVLRGLEEIHAQGIVHRDLKPGNVLLGCAGEVKLGDFGIALEADAGGLTRPGVVVASPPYAAPEQLRGERVDARSDLYAWGVLVYEMLAGKPPFRAETEGEEATALLERMLREDYTEVRQAAPHTPRALARAIRACLRARPAKRPGAAADLRAPLERRLGRPDPGALRDEIARWLRDQRVIEPDASRTERRPRAPRRRAPRRLARRAGLVAALAAGAGALAALAPRVAG